MSTKSLSKYNPSDTDDAEEIDIGIPAYRTATMNQLPPLETIDEEYHQGRWYSGCYNCFRGCSNFFCCGLKSGRIRACGCCTLLLLTALISLIAWAASNHVHKSKEILYTIGHSSLDEYNILQDAIKGKGIDLCKVPVVPRYYPACQASVTLFGRSGVPYLRAIVEEGTRVSTMDKFCKESIIPVGDFQWECLDESWFHQSSLAAYDYHLSRPTRVFNTTKTVFLIRDPFDSVVDLYYRRYWSRRMNPFKGDPIKTFSDHQNVMTFAIKEFKEWNQYMEDVKKFIDTHLEEEFHLVWYDELDSDQLWKNATQSLFTFIRDPDYYPTPEQSIRCVDQSSLDDGPSYLKGIPKRDFIFSANDRKTLCPLVIENWEHQRWGDFCVSG